MTRDALSFEQLLAAIAQAHGALAEQASRAVNVSLTLRNWCIGFYLAEFEQNGADRAQYGARLMEEVSSRLKRLAIPGVASRSLRQCRQFYQTYPQIGRAVAALDRPALLPSRIWQTPSAKFDRAAGQDLDRPESGTIDIPAHRLLTELSFSHFAELLQIEDPQQRTFYEVECLRGHWSVRELKRQINTLYFERSGLSTAPVGLLLCTHKNEELVEYALAGLSQPLFVSRYQVHLPDKAAMAKFVHQAVQELRDAA